MLSFWGSYSWCYPESKLLSDKSVFKIFPAFHTIYVRLAYAHISHALYVLPRLLRWHAFSITEMRALKNKKNVCLAFFFKVTNKAAVRLLDKCAINTQRAETHKISTWDGSHWRVNTIKPNQEYNNVIVKCTQLCKQAGKRDWWIWPQMVGAIVQV